MDALAGLLDGPRARGAFFIRSIFDPPFGIRIEDDAPLTLICLVRGAAWLVPSQDDPVRLGPGDVALVRGTEPYVVADTPSRQAEIVVQPGQRTTDLRGGELCAAMDLGVRAWGDNPRGSVMMITCSYQLPGEIGHRLLETLPTRVVLPADSWDCPLLPLLSTEVEKDLPGQEAVLDRLLDLLLIAALRAWLDRPDAPAWYRAHGDPVVSKALQLLHEAPDQAWTIGNLAARVGVSRAVLARRFADLVGEPPIGYLTNLRLTIAADLLREPHATLDAVARQVGYGSSFALSTAFKRVRGMSPQEHRRGQPTPK
ncbi:AraC family transcriptional regulator [Fodinicola acaciae]|uniref:AraC family transcriptional regulator n=1 Tax=Fodinicola acaciae TaxID=2681555 RepID=UPI0013D3CFCB|nr:AraC family transcriptional regulator [Fodinicola acaciae]